MRKHFSKDRYASLVGAVKLELHAVITGFLAEVAKRTTGVYATCLQACINEIPLSTREFDVT